MRLSFCKGACTVTGSKSDYSLYTKELATYDEGDTFDHKSAKGFINIYSLFGKVWAEKHRG